MGEIFTVKGLRMNIVIIGTVILTGMLLAGCKPEKLDVSLYTSDIQEARSGKILEVPVKLAFSIIGEDKDDDVPRAVEVAKKYLSKDSKFTQSKGDFGSKLVVETFLPLGTEASLARAGVLGNAVARLTVKPNEESTAVSFEPGAALVKMNRELSKISYTLDLNLPAKQTYFVVNNDLRAVAKVSATAVHISGKPNLHYRGEIANRRTAEIQFNGCDECVYGELSPTIFVAVAP
jgi:hypothetical protein